MKTKTKYTALEIERRWLVKLNAMPSLDGYPFREIVDLYVANSHLRLRAVYLDGQPPVYKFGKKYGKQSPLVEATTNLYLSEAEYQTLSQLPGARVSKRRYAIDGGSLDLYQSPGPTAMFEAEFESEESALQYSPPLFAGLEVTGDPGYSGAALALRAAKAGR